MDYRCQGLIFIGLFALSACDAGRLATDASQSLQQPGAAAGNETKAKGKTPRSALDALNGHQGLQVESGDYVLHLTGSGCKEFAGDVAVCDREPRLEITSTDGSFHQTLTPASVFVDDDALVYRGTLDGANKPDTHTFVLSDVNGDALDDLMVWSGRDGAYGGPSFDVYLFDAAGPGFRLSQPWSELTVGYLGLFGVQDGKIRTTSKSGCCIHVYETYLVENNLPKLIERVTEDATKEDDLQTTTERLIDGALKEVEVEQNP